MFEPNKIVTALAGVAAAGALVAASAPAATAAPHAAKAAGKNAYAKTTDPEHWGRIKFYHVGNKVKICKMNTGKLAAQGYVAFKLSKGWAKSRFSAGTKKNCHDSSINLKNGTPVKVKVWLKAKNGKVYSPSKWVSGVA